MRCGLFGKLACKADYVAIEAPRPFLATFEPWLHSGVSSSRQQLGGSWRDVFLAAPIWRFWLGGDICGASVVGTLMPSIDAQGQYFPLSVFAAAKTGAAIPPPEFDDHGAWFRLAENLLLSTLAPNAPFEKTAAALDRLPAPRAYPPVAARPPLLKVEGGVTSPLDDHAPTQVFEWLRRADWAEAYASRSFWWTLGGADFRPRALALRHMPESKLFAAMLTGDFDRFGD